jgi:hypothetical protein
MALRDQKVRIAAGEQITLAVDADYLRIKKSNIPVRFKTVNGDDFEIKQGDEVSIASFQYVYIKNESAGDEVIDLYTGTKERVGSAELSGSVALTGDVSLSAATLAALENVTVQNVSGAFTQGRASVTNVNQVLIAANAARRYLLIQNNDASAVMRVNIAGNAAAAGQGFRVQAGGVLELSGFQSTQAINVMMETATAAAGNVEFSEG